MKLLFYFFCFSLLSSQSAMDLALALLVLAGLKNLLKKEYLKVELKELNTFVFLSSPILLVSVFSYIFSSVEKKSIVDLWELRWIIEIPLISLAISKVEFNQNTIRKFSYLAIIATLYALITYFIGWNPIFNQYRDPLLDPFDWRAGGFFAHAMPLAHSYAILMCFYFGVLFNQYKQFYIFDALKKHWIDLLAFVLLSLTVFFTYTRGVWIGAFFAILIGSLLINRRAFIISICSLILLFIACFFFSPKFRERTLGTAQVKFQGDEQRLALWNANIEMAKDNILFGVGYGQSRKVLRDYFDKLGYPNEQFEGHAHNSYIQWLSNTGVLGLFSYSIFILGLLRVTFSAFSREQEPFFKSAFLGIFICQICFHINALTEANFFIAKNRTMFLFMIAIYFSISIRRARGSNDVKN